MQQLHSVLVLAALLASSLGSPAAEGLDAAAAEALSAGEDECLANAGEGCALNALQLRATSMAVRQPMIARPPALKDLPGPAEGGGAPQTPTACVLPQIRSVEGGVVFAAAPWGEQVLVVSGGAATPYSKYGGAFFMWMVSGTLTLLRESSGKPDMEAGEEPMHFYAVQTTPSIRPTSGGGMLAAAVGAEPGGDTWLRALRFKRGGAFLELSCRGASYAPTTALSLSPDGARAAYGSGRHLVVRRVPSSAAGPCEAPKVRDTHRRVVAVVWRPSGAAVAVLNEHAELVYRALRDLRPSYSASVPGAGRGCKCRGPAMPSKTLQGCPGYAPLLVWRSTMIFVVTGNQAEGHQPQFLESRASCAEQPRVQVVLASTFKLIHSFELGTGKESFASAMDASPDGKYLAAAWTDSSGAVGFHVWDMQSDLFDEITPRFRAIVDKSFKTSTPPTQAVCTDRPHDCAYVTSLTFGANSSKLIIGGSNGQVVVAKF